MAKPAGLARTVEKYGKFGQHAAANAKSNIWREVGMMKLSVGVLSLANFSEVLLKGGRKHPAVILIERWQD